MLTHGSEQEALDASPFLMNLDIHHRKDLCHDLVHELPNE